jgi:SAM-dependent methyltransferase
MTTILHEYQEKAPSYFEYERAEMLEMIPNNVRRVLDVGCGSGQFGRLVKQERGAEVWGVEPSLRACKEAENCFGPCGPRRIRGVVDLAEKGLSRGGVQPRFGAYGKSLGCVRA